MKEDTCTSAFRSRNYRITNVEEAYRKLATRTQERIALRLMETINTTAVVKEGHITIAVPAEDGTSVNVTVRPRLTPEEVEASLERARRLRKETTARAPDPETLKKWIEEGRL